MDEERFDGLTRILGSGATRRGVIAAGAGLLGLHVAEPRAARRKRTKQRARKRRKDRRLGAQQLVTIAEGCPNPAPTSIDILSAFYPGYWWDHTDLTVAIKAHPRADRELVAAAHEAIAIWDRVLRKAFAGRITLTDVTGTTKAAHKADIVVHYVPKAGGVVWEGRAQCGAHKCPNITVRSDLPPSLGLEPSSPQYFGWVVLHELGHALGLGHAEPLWETNDLMGYGWPPLEPVLSPCDLRALEAVFAWAFAGAEPHPPTVASVSCSGLCGVA